MKQSSASKSYKLLSFGNIAIVLLLIALMLGSTWIASPDPFHPHGFFGDQNPNFATNVTIGAFVMLIVGGLGIALIYRLSRAPQITGRISIQIVFAIATIVIVQFWYATGPIVRYFLSPSS